jgi:hypothetical protein
LPCWRNLGINLTRRPRRRWGWYRPVSVAQACVCFVRDSIGPSLQSPAASRREESGCLKSEVFSVAVWEVVSRAARLPNMLVLSGRVRSGSQSASAMFYRERQANDGARMSRSFASRENDPNFALRRNFRMELAKPSIIGLSRRQIGRLNGYIERGERRCRKRVTRV